MSVVTTIPARGRFFEDFQVGQVFRSRTGRTIIDADNVWFTAITHNTNQAHFNTPYAERTPFGRPLVNSCLTLSLITGLSVPDTSENAAANLAWSNIVMPSPVFVGDTLWAETEVLELRPSASRPEVGIVDIRTRGINQDGTTVIAFQRTFMVYRRDAPQAADLFPEPTSDWS